MQPFFCIFIYFFYTQLGMSPAPRGYPLLCQALFYIFLLSFRKAARINLATSHRTLHDVDALAFEPSAQLVYRLFARVSEVRRDLWVWGKVERAFPCRL